MSLTFSKCSVRCGCFIPWLGSFSVISSRSWLLPQKDPVCKWDTCLAGRDTAKLVEKKTDHHVKNKQITETGWVIMVHTFNHR